MIFLKSHQIWLSYTCFCILSNISDSKIGPFWHKNHTHFYFFYWNHQRLPKKIFHIRNLGFHKCIPKKVLKPLEIGNMTCFGYKNGPLWTMPISKLKLFWKILVGKLISFQRLYFFEKSLDLVELCLLLYPE